MKTSEDLLDEIEALRQEKADLRIEHDRRQDEIEKLRAALRPFAEYAEAFDKCSCLKVCSCWEDMRIPTVGDCRRAAEALAAVAREGE